MFLLLVICSLFARAQNLVANPGFEDINNCTEYHSDCGIEAWFNIPPVNTLVKYKAAPVPVLGHNFLVLPVENVYEKPGNRGVVYTMLRCPLSAGRKYKISFFINSSGRKFYHLDFCFLESDPNKPGFKPTNLIPSFSITEPDLETEYKLGWKIVEREFMATANDNYLVIGNFSPEKMAYEQKDMMNRLGDVLYFIDEMSVKAIDPVPLCSDYDKRQAELYKQDYRHTEFVSVEKEIPLQEKNELVNDTIIIPAVLFKTNSSELRQSFYNMLDSICEKLKTKTISNIYITGHTDNTGTQQINEQLSLARANSIRRYIATKIPELDPIITTSGKASMEPVADNKTSEGRQQNRRVQIIVTRLNKQD
ncbi:MAG: OmpA family protein [Bacteroidetes bacterium]|nr:OmpA family protein [Bacteroidota bacterium]